MNYTNYIVTVEFLSTSRGQIIIAAPDEATAREQALKMLPPEYSGGKVVAVEDYTKEAPVLQ